jgi:uncharacterized protein (DUF885 family)
MGEKQRTEQELTKQKQNERELAEEYRQLDKELADLHYQLAGTAKEEPHLLLPTQENRKKLEAKQAELLKRAEHLVAREEVFAIWKDHFTDFAKAEQLNIEQTFSHPQGVLGGMMWRMEDLTRRDSREPAVKLNEFLRLTGELADVMEVLFDGTNGWELSVYDGIVSSIEDWEAIWEVTMERIRTESRTLAKEEAEAFERGTQQLKEALAQWKERAKTVRRQSAHANEKQAPQAETEIPDEEKTFRFEESYYRRILHEQLGVELDELLSWYEDEVKQTRDEVFAIANRLDIPENHPKNMKEVNDILLKYAGPCDSPEEMFRRGRDYLDRAQKAARAYVWMPSDEYCGLVGVPESLKFSYPWGGYEGGDGRRRPVYGQFFLNHYNYKAVTDGWIKMQAVHEAYPGHHVQYVREITDFLPETAKIGVKYIPMIEGMAHRSERMFEWIYPEDPYYPLFVAYRRHHTAVRIQADLMLRYFGNPIRDIVKLYMDELGFDYNTARGQIKAQESMEGYFTCYYYGMKKICDWEKQYGFDEKTYTELLFSAGYVSLENFHRFLKLNEADRRRYCTLFYSKYKNPKETFGREI